MDKLELVEESFRNGDQLVLYDEWRDRIFVCFGDVEIRSDNEIAFLDCSIAEIDDEQEEYYGEVKYESYDIAFFLPEDVIEGARKGYIPSCFGEGEMIDMVKIN